MPPRRLLLLLPVLLLTLACASASQSPVSTPPPTATAPAFDECTPTCCCWPCWAKCASDPEEPGCCANCEFGCGPGTPPGCCQSYQCPATAVVKQAPDGCGPATPTDCSSGTPIAPPPPAPCAPSETPCGLGPRQPGQLQFAVIGDWGDNVCQTGQTCPATVASLIKSWNDRWPLDFILTTGDNFYPGGNADAVAANMSLYDWIGPQPAGPDDALRFLPSVGNHDLYNAGCGQPYYDYFQFLSAYSPTKTPRYYSYPVPGGLIEVFSINANNSEPDGTGVTCTQAQWLKQALARSNAAWKIVIFHEPPFSTYYPGTTPKLDWPFSEWGASIVLTGHIHAYERIVQPDTALTYVINGIGGVNGKDPITNEQCFPPIAGSQVRYTSAVGAMIGVATAKELRFCLLAVDANHPDGMCVDRFSILK